MLVLEKNAGLAEHSRAPAIWPGTQEILDDLGTIDRFLSEGISVARLEPWDVARRRPLVSLPLEELSRETRHPRLLILPQPRTEALLLDAVRRESGAEVRFGAEVAGIEQGALPVVRLRDGSAFRARFVAGCDGAHGVARDAIGASFDGRTYRMRAALADVELDGTDDLPFPRVATRPAVAVGIRMGAGLWRLILPFAGDEARDDGELDRRVANAVRALFDRDAPPPLWRSTFRLHRRIASRLALGRVALAGDAAHRTSPVGGQGMNSGIADAARLAAALDLALRSDDTAPLDAYARERRAAVAGGVNRFTDLLTRALLAGNGRLLRPTFAAARTAFAIPPVRRAFLRRLAMLR